MKELRIEKKLNGVSVFFKGKKVLSHTKQKPLISLGSGTFTFKDRHGLYKINDKVSKKIHLTEFEFGEDTIKFWAPSSNIHMILNFSFEDRVLRIEPKCSDESLNRFWIKFVAYPTEGIFGCGEQFSKLNLKGNNVPLWCQEQGIGRGDPKWFTFLANLFAGVGGSWYTTYHPQPTFVSTESYFVHSTHTSYSEIDFSKRENTTLYTWEIPKDIFIGVLDNVENTVGAVSKLIGRQPELPEWAYDGFWIAIQKGSNAVRARLQKALDKGVKVGGIWSQDWEGIRKTAFGTQLMWNWEYSKELFPDIQEFIAELNTKGIKFLGYINSFLALEGNLYAEAKEKNYCVKDKEGNDYYVYVTTFPAAIVDLTNPDAFEWIKGVMKKNMIEVGLTGWMSDFGEYLPPDAVLFSGEDAAIVHNKFPVLWQKANYEALQEAGKLGEIIFFTRAGYSGTSKYSTLIWAGDQLPTWSIDDGLASVIVAGQSIGVSGVGYYHSDVGGYTTFGPFKRTKELFMRWAEHSAFTMVMRSHEGNRPEANWQFDSDDESLEHLAKMTAIYTAMKPYMIAISKEYQEIGLPAMRAMFIHYSKDSEVLNLKYQYLFGKDLLVAPVYKKGKKSVKVYIPENGTWVHLWSDKEMVKGYAEIDAPIGQPPVFYRKDSKFADLFKSLKDL